MPRCKMSLKDLRADPVPNLIRPLMIEFFSQFVMTFWGIMAVDPYKEPTVIESNNRTIVIPVEKDYLKDTFAPAFQTGLSVWIQIVLFAKMSFAPAQFNPAITMVFVVVGTVPPILMIPNIIAQCMGSIFASFMSQAIRGAPPAILIIPDDASSLSIFINELILVAAFSIFAAELTQNPDNDDPMGPFALGMGVFMALLSTTGVVCLSPSRVIGPAVVTGGPAWNRHWLVWVADLLGGAGAGAFWLFFFAPFDTAWIGRFVNKRKNETRSDILMAEMNEKELEA